MHITIGTETKRKNSGGTVREQREVSNFTRVSVSGSATLHVTQGDSEWVIVEADEALMPYVITEVVGDTLKLHLEDNVVRSLTRRGTIHFFVGCKTLQAVSLSGSTSAQIPSLHVPELRCSASGSSSLKIDLLEAERLEVKASGSASISIAGRVNHQSIHGSGSLSYHAGQLNSQYVQVESSGASDLTLWANESLEIKSASGACVVRYYGLPHLKFPRSITTRLIPLGEPVV